MRDRFYQDQSLAELVPGGELVLSEKVSRHVGRVLRFQPDALISLFNGDGYEYCARITQVEKKRVTVCLESRLHNSRQSPLHTHLFQCISKGDRMDFAIRKAVESGVTEITPVISEFSEFKLNAQRVEKKRQHWQQVIISACEQCGLNTLPTLHDIQPLEQALNQAQGLKLALHPTDQATPLKQPHNSPISLLIGPEGGLSGKDLNIANHEGFQCWSLGPRILRTETAPISALSILQHLFGDY